MREFFNEDCFKTMKSMKDGSVKLIVTDPPYGIDFKGVTSNTDWDSSIIYHDFLIMFLTEAKRILTDDWLTNIDYELAKEYIDSRVHNL